MLAEEKHKQIVMQSLAFLVKEKRIWLYGYVIMTNHIHILWRKQDAWLDKSVQQQFLKFTAQKIKFNLLENFPDKLKNYQSTQTDRAYHFWERRAYKATMFSRSICEQKLDYMHNNPVKAGICELPEEYFYSSAPYYFQKSESSMLTHYMEHI